jgi:hypothetical protein
MPRKKPVIVAGDFRLINIGDVPGDKTKSELRFEPAKPEAAVVAGTRIPLSNKSHITVPLDVGNKMRLQEVYSVTFRPIEPEAKS